MAKLIKGWKELEGLESENYKIELDYFEGDSEPHSGHIKPKVETKETEDNYWDHHYYLSTHTFYGHAYQESTEVLQKFGFDVEIDNWDKDDPRWSSDNSKLTIGVDSDIVRYNNNLKFPKEPKLTTNQRKIKEFKEKANRPDASDNDVKKLIRACGGDVDKAVSLINDEVDYE